MFKILKLLIAFIMLVDSTLVFAARAKKKNRKRNRAALSYRITRGKTNGTNIKNGDLKFKKPGEIFNKIEKDLKTPHVNSTPNLPDNKQPEPQQDNDLLDDNLPPPEAVPYLAPYISTQQQNSKAPEDPNKELKETIKELKNKLASAKNTCGTYTTMMANINKQLGLGVSMTSGIGLGLSAIATTTGAISYGKSKQQDKNFTTHAGNQKAIKDMVGKEGSLLNFNGGTGDNDDLSKITAINKTLADDKIKAFEDAKSKLASAKEKWDEADKIAKQAEDDLNNNEEQEPDDGAESTIEIPKNLQGALTAAKNLPTEPKPTTPKNPPKKPVKDPEEERVATLEKDAEEAERKIAEAKEKLENLKDPSQNPAEETPECKEAKTAALEYEKCPKVDKAEYERAKAYINNPKNDPNKYPDRVNRDHAKKCQNASQYLAGIKNSSIYSYLKGERDSVTPTIKPDKSLIAMANNNEAWSTIKYFIDIGHCCKNGSKIKGREVNLFKGNCIVIGSESDPTKWNNNKDIVAKGDDADKKLKDKEVKEQKCRDITEKYNEDVENYKNIKAACNANAIAEAAKQRQKATTARNNFNKQKQDAELAAAEKEKQDNQELLAKLEEKRKQAIAAAQQAIADDKEKQLEKWKQEQAGKPNPQLVAAENEVNRLKGIAKEKQDAYEELETQMKEKEAAAKEQAEKIEQQKRKATEFANKQTALSNSAATIQKNHKTSRNLDIATATFSAVSSVASGVSMGFSIATIEAVKEAITQLGKCKEDVRQIKLLHGKYVALTTD